MGTCAHLTVEILNITINTVCIRTVLPIMIQNDMQQCYMHDQIAEKLQLANQYECACNTYASRRPARAIGHI